MKKKNKKPKFVSTYKNFDKDPFVRKFILWYVLFLLANYYYWNYLYIKGI